MPFKKGGSVFPNGMHSESVNEWKQRGFATKACAVDFISQCILVVMQCCIELNEMACWKSSLSIA